MKKYLSSYPELVKEWHPSKNGDLKPEDVTCGSSKKVWWLCPKGHSHKSTISNRTGNKTGCPYCSGNLVGEDNNLLVLFPKIANEWHPTKNGDLTPSKVTHGTAKKVWWLCPDKGHSYVSKINARTAMGTHCPYCSGRRVGEDNNLFIRAPEIAKEWHPTKNKDLTPKDFTLRSTKRVWWLCPKGHDYQTAIGNRTIGHNCPHCTNQSSEPEIRILSELKSLFDEVKSRYKIDGVEIDIYIPEYNLGIEYDGKYWHKENEDLDLKKNSFLLSKEIKLIRVRQHPLIPLTDDDVVINTNRSLEKKHLDKIFKKIYLFVNRDIKKRIDDYISKDSFVNETLFRKYISYFPSPFPEKSLLNTHPSIAEQWDYDKNSPLRPENFTFGSAKIMWWLCHRGHSYESAINRKTSYKNICPYCKEKKTLNYDLFN